MAEEVAEEASEEVSEADSEEAAAEATEETAKAAWLFEFMDFEALGAIISLYGTISYHIV